MDGEFTTQQAEFLKYYLDPNSETFNNAYQSAIKVGYSEDYAAVITGRDLKWLSEMSEKVSDSGMLRKAEKNLDKALDIPIEDKEIGERSLKASLFVTERLGKNKWSSKQEIEHKGEVSIKTLEDSVKKIAEN